MYIEQLCDKCSQSLFCFFVHKSPLMFGFTVAHHNSKTAPTSGIFSKKNEHASVGIVC